MKMPYEVHRKKTAQHNDIVRHRAIESAVPGFHGIAAIVPRVKCTRNRFIPTTSSNNISLLFPGEWIFTTWVQQRALHSVRYGESISKVIVFTLALLNHAVLSFKNSLNTLCEHAFIGNVLITLCGLGCSCKMFEYIYWWRYTIFSLWCTIFTPSFFYQTSSLFKELFKRNVQMNRLFVSKFVFPILFYTENLKDHESCSKS